MEGIPFRTTPLYEPKGMEQSELTQRAGQSRLEPEWARARADAYENRRRTRRLAIGRIRSSNTNSAILHTNEALLAHLTSPTLLSRPCFPQLSFFCPSALLQNDSSSLTMPDFGLLDSLTPRIHIAKKKEYVDCFIDSPSSLLSMIITSLMDKVK